VCWYFPFVLVGFGTNCPSSYSIDGSWTLVAVLVLVIVITLARSNNRTAVDSIADQKLESALQLEIARTKDTQWAPTWTAPKLPSSVIASIWTNRFVHGSAQPPSKIQRYASTLRRLTGDYGRAAPYIIGAAFLSLRDAGLINFYVDPPGKVLDSFHRVRVERTDMPLPSVNMPAVEGGLLLAVLDLAHKRFRKEAQPAAFSVVTEWIHQNQSNPSRWVAEVALQQGRELGLYEPMIKKRAWYGKMVDDKPVYSVEHLAACDDQAVACAARWHDFEAGEPEVGRLVTEIGFAVESRRERTGG
jgi:hypothetical protein